MHRRTRTPAWVALLLMAAMALSACGRPAEQNPPPTSSGSGSTDQPGDSTGPIVIGFVNHLTGDIAMYGESMKKGTEVAVKEINDNGGINGRELRVIYEDDKSDPSQAVAAVHKLVEQDHVPVIMGSSSSTITLAMAQPTGEAGVVQITASSTNPALSEFKDHMFMVMPSDASQGAEWANIAREWGITEAAVMYINNDYGIGVRDIFVQNFTANGGKVLAEQGFNAGATDLRTEVLKVKESGARYVFMVAHVPEGSLVLKQAQEQGLQATWIMDVAMQSDETLAQAGAAAEGVLAVQVGLKEHDGYRKFVDQFKALHNSDPTIWADFAYDTTRLVAEAIKHAGTDPKAIADWLRQVKDFPGATGPITFGDDGFRKAEGSWQLYQVKDGKWEVFAGD